MNADYKAKPESPAEILDEEGMMPLPGAEDTMVMKTYKEQELPNDDGAMGMITVFLAEMQDGSERPWARCGGFSLARTALTCTLQRAVFR